MRRDVPLPSPRAVHVVDALVAAWVVVCIALGSWFTAEIRDLQSLPRTLGTAGEGLENAGRALQALPAVVVGEDIETVAADAREAGTQARASAVDAREGLDTLSVLTGLTVALVPTGAVLLFYLPLRLGWRRLRRDTAPPS